MKRSRAIADLLQGYASMPGQPMQFSSMVVNVALVYHGARRCAILDGFNACFTPADTAFLNEILKLRCFEMRIYQNNNEWLIWGKGNETLTKELDRDDVNVGKHLGYFCGDQSGWKHAKRRFFVHVSEQTTQTHILSQACVADKTNKKGLQRHLIKQCASMQAVLKMYAPWCKVVYTVRGQQPW